MLQKTTFIAPLDKILEVTHVFDEAKKYDLTEPTGDFFYDPWKLKDEYQGTPWVDIWSSLPINTGQARVIVLQGGSGYYQHADIDDRYHLNLRGDSAYLIDLENEVMHKCVTDGIWYEMDAGRLHSAASFGEHNRVQLVVRKLLERNNLKDPVAVRIRAEGEKSRYSFDNTLSPWLNRANKRKIISNFETNGASVYFDLEKEFIEELKQHTPQEFKLEI
jgi:hypothetical protein